MGQAAIDERAPEKTTGHPSPHMLLGIVMVAAVFAVNVYRATHQSITPDEAYAWDFYIANPFNWILIVYGANNHVVHTLLCRLSVKALGLSELTLRLPSLAGGLLYLVFIYKLCRILFKNLWVFLLALAALTLNPFITDYLSVARGYGMALGFFIAALYLVIRFFDDESETTGARAVTFACIALGLSISTNLAFLFPSVALAGILTLLLLIDAQAGGWSRRLLWIVGRVWLPLTCSAGLFLAIPLAHAKRGDFYYGVDSLRETALSLVQRSLFHQYNIWMTEPIPDIVARSAGIVATWIVPAMLTIVFAMLARICSRWLRARNFRALGVPDRAYVLIAAVLAICLGMLVAAHYLARMLYPPDRTAIYLVVLATLAWAALIEKALNGPNPHPVIGTLASVPAVIAILLFLRGFTTSYYYEWRYDAGTKRIFHLLQGQNHFSAGNQMRLGVNWRLNFSFNFYRRMYHADWLAEVLRDPPPEAGGYDYYVVFPDEWEPMRKLGLRVIYRDPVSDEILAAPIISRNSH
jgi:hypothetical protein